MVVCVILAKILGALYVVPLTRLIGSQGLAIYQNGYSLYMILLTLATSGLPTAMGKLISERLAGRQHAEVEQIFRVTLRTVTLLAIACALVTWFGAPLYSYLVAVRDAKGSAASLVWSIRALAPAVLVVPFLSALRGYMQGFQRMDWSGYSQTVEQLFRVIAMVVGAAIAVHWFTAGSTASVAAGAAAATFGAFVGAVAGLALLTYYTVRLRRQTPHSAPRQRAPARSRRTNGRVSRLLWSVALPICAGALVVPLSNLADSLTVQNFLMVFAHDSLRQAQVSFGILSRQAFTLIQLPLAFSLAIGSSVLPAISGAMAVHDHRQIQRTVENTFRSMFFITFPMAAAFFVLAKPLDILLFGSVQGVPIIQSISFMGIFSALEQVSTYILQGMGKLYRPVRNLFLGVLVKVVCNLLLIPHFGIMGAALATTIGYLFSSALNVLAVKKYGRLQFSAWRQVWPSFGSTVIILALMWGVRVSVARVFHAQLTQDDIAGAALIIAIALPVSGLLYLWLSIRLRVVTTEELGQLPGLGRYLNRRAGGSQAARPARSVRPPGR